MSQHAAPTARRNTRTVAAAAFGVGALALTGAGVYAGLTAEATNTTAESVGSGTLKLELDATGATSLGVAVTNLAPGDVNNRYVVLTNTGTLAGKNLGLNITDSAGNILSTSTSKGLSASVTGCSVAWVANTCVGTETAYIAKTQLSTLAARTAFAGPVNPASSGAYNLRVSLHLDGNETVLNGALPTGTIQGQTANLTYRFTEDQRDGVTTNG